MILANNLGHRATIYPRQTLRIPVSGTAASTTQNPPPKNPEPVLLADADTPKPDTADGAPAESEKTYPEPVFASVLPTSIAKEPLPAVQDDPLPEDELLPSAEVVSVDVRFLHIHPHPKRPTGTIQVEVEETLGHFGEWAAVRAQEIRRLNSLPFGKKLRLHQKVKIPLHKASAQIFEEQRYEYHKRLQEDFFAVYRISEMRAYQVQRGDNLWTLCLNKFNIPMWLLKNCNPQIDFAALRTRQKLMVPTIEKQSMDAQDNETESDPEEMEEPETPFSLL